ncbi:MAG TPA: FG-GAP repeat protein, partial [Acidimicrobiales bacterium]
GVGGSAEDADQFGSALAAGDVDGDGSADLAVGAPFEAVGAVDAAGAVNVLPGSTPGGLSGTGSQIFTQDTPGVPGTAETFDTFGFSLVVTDSG